MKTLSGVNQKSLRPTDFFSSLSIVIVIVVFTIINPNFLSPINIKYTLIGMAPLLVVAVGVTFVLLIGSVDLSVGAICSCACVMTGLGFPLYGNAIIVPVLIFGITAGFINGLLFTKLKIPSFIVTLCTMNIWNCAALLLSGGRPKGIPIKLWPTFGWVNISFGSAPLLFVLSLLFLIAFYIVQEKTALGKSIFATGANQRAAGIMGIPISRITIGPFVFSGLGAALSGIFYGLIQRSSLPKIGDPLTLMAMAAVALGGTPLSGGRGSVVKTLGGVFLVMVIRNGLDVVGVDSFWQQIVFGTLVIFAVFLNSDKRGRNLIIK